MNAEFEEGDIRLVFVVGASRSGTTMLNRILGNHNSILALNELHYFGEIWNPKKELRLLGQVEAQDCAARLLAVVHRGIWDRRPNSEEYSEARAIVAPLDSWNHAVLFEAVLGAQARGRGCVYVTDQTPRNIFYAEELLELYPKAYVIHIVRDPRAVLFSQKKRWRKRGLGADSMPWWNVLRVMVNYHPLTMAQLWVRAVRRGLVLEGHPRVKHVIFESLLRNPNEEVRSLCHFLGIDFEASMLEVPVVGSSHRKHLPGTSGICAEVADAWRNDLGDSDLQACEWVASEMMGRLGYARLTREFSKMSLLSAFLTFPLHSVGVLISNPRRAWIQLHAALFGRRGRGS